MLNTYLSYSLIARDLPTALGRVEKQPLVDRDTDYYLENISKVKTIDEFVKNDRLFRYAMKAHGLEDMAYAKAFMVKALKEGISDPDSFANKLSDKRYAEFVATYNFEKHGELATSYNRAQHEVPQNFRMQVEMGVLAGGFGYARDETAHFLANIGTVTSIDGLLADERLLEYALNSVGLDPEVETPERVRAMLEGGVADPASPANSSPDKRWANFVSRFDFVQFGAETTARDAVQKLAPKEFMARTGLTLVKPQPGYVKAETDHFAANIGKVKSIDDLMKDTRLLTVAMAAYGLDASAEKPATIRQMLQGGIASPTAPANTTTTRNWAAFVSAFNFAEHGEQATARDAVTSETPRLYGAKSELGLVKPNADYIKAEEAYYLANVVKLESIDDLMADRRLLAFALSAYGLDADREPPATIRAMLEGGISDPASPANQLSDKRYAGFVAAFDFADHGEAATTIADARRPAIDKFIRQTLEENAGKQNEGVRLALYFERKAPEITNFYEILADPALAKVVRTILSLPDSFATAEIDKQVQLFESRLDIADLSDPKALGKLMTRFTSMWEIGNPTAAPQSAASILFAQPAEFGVSTNLLLAMQQMRL